MSAPDISRILELIMQNPGLVAEIQGLVKNESSPQPKNLPEPEHEPEEKPEPKPTESSVSRSVQPEMSQKERRALLLSAMKSYVSSERARAIDSMMAVSEILEVMKTR